ncbi:MAG: CHAP domain-containing protein [Paraburkholderia sp.]|uniref:CHAP domain-containing protein n=1 Tax=Paraburkholderia sp. TaxID=1926495 RepID=UPI0011F6E9DA|nr:CHAP domain-containing protein [Paraburkholderia sp.]TAM00709.1 MAG: CHAP domain-containing protein [Paraburkholderia sp.]TAM32402.1 MAG: CHAP domain-containing protein [Paraburkholderia sp.]
MPWDPRGAASRAEQRSRSTSQGRCAEYVRLAVEAGGIVLSRHADAKDYGRSLEDAGFYRANGEPQVGDVIVIQPAPGHAHGHMAIYSGSIWISDFKQLNGFYPGPAYRTARPSYQIYRHN